jgi:hypothetical protein
MADDPGQDGIAATGASVVSMFQANCTAILAKVLFGASGSGATRSPS